MSSQSGAEALKNESNKLCEANEVHHYSPQLVYLWDVQITPIF